MYKPLTQEQKEQIAQEFFESRAKKSALKVDNPVIVLIGAQPGAGKSAVSAAIKSELESKGGSISVDADVMRKRINTHGFNPKSEETQADAGALANLVREKAIQGRRNIIEEGTFRDPTALKNYIDGAGKAGYKIELVALATNKEESLLGIYARYEEQIAAGLQNPRFVQPEYHNQAMQGFDTSVAMHAGRFDRVTVVNRDRQVLFDSQGHEEGQGAKALDALYQGRVLPDERLQSVSKAWGVLHQMAADRGANQRYLSSVEEHASRVSELKNERIHSHALAKLEDNMQALGADARFAGHDEGEMLKAAYYRGFHEKAAFFADARPEFDRYDSAAAQKDLVHSLPNVLELNVLEFERSHARDAQKGRGHDGLEL